MVIKYVSVCEYRAPRDEENIKKLTHLKRMVCFGKHKHSYGFMFEPFLHGEKRVLKVYKLPRTMRTRAEVRDWFKINEAKQLFNMVANSPSFPKKNTI